ncbi:hypothetical protein Tco_1474650 [Tanacetum coccineum]
MSVSTSIAHEAADCDKKTTSNNRKPRIVDQQSNEPIEKWVHKRNYYVSNVCARLLKEICPKVVFGDNSSGDTEGYSLVNYNGITFTKVAYVNGLKHNLVNIIQLCDANFNVLFTKT